LRIYVAAARLEEFGAWLSLVERLVRDQEAGGSNPLAPTILSFPFSNTWALRQKRGRSDPGLFYEHNTLTRIR
jgi:hypothetical protein